MKKKSKTIIIILIVSVILIATGLCLVLKDNSSKKNEEPISTPTPEENSDEISEKSFELSGDQGVEKSVIIRREENQSHVYVLMTNHESTPYELTNYTVDIFDSEKQYITSKSFETVTLEPKGNHLFDFVVDNVNFDVTGVGWHITNQ